MIQTEQSSFFVPGSLVVLFLAQSDRETIQLLQCYLSQEVFDGN